MNVETDKPKHKMNADLERLVSLQKLDSDIARKEKLLLTLPEELKAAYASCEEAKANLKAFDDEIEGWKKESRGFEKDVEDFKVKIANDKTKLPNLKTNVEYRALIKELEGYEKKISALDDKQIELMENLEAKAGDRKALEDAVKTEEAQYAVDKSEKEAAIETVKAAVSALKQKRAGTIGDITSSIYQTYERVLKNRNGIGTVKVADKMCLGCHQMIPPQLYYQIRTSDDIFQCPHCDRYLYHVPEEGEENS